MENTIENNKLIAEFMSSVYDEKEKLYYFSSISLKSGKNYFNQFELKFDTDWNWLMEVVEKIETTSYDVPEKYQKGFMKNTLNATGVIYSDYDDRVEFLGWSSYCTLGTQTIWDSTMLGEITEKYKTKIEAVYNAVVAFIKWQNSAQKEN